MVLQHLLHHAFASLYCVHVNHSLTLIPNTIPPSNRLGNNSPSVFPIELAPIRGETTNVKTQLRQRRSSCEEASRNGSVAGFRQALKDSSVGSCIRCPQFSSSACGRCVETRGWQRESARRLQKDGLLAAMRPREPLTSRETTRPVMAPSIGRLRSQRRRSTSSTHRHWTEESNNGWNDFNIKLPNLQRHSAA